MQIDTHSDRLLVSVNTKEKQSAFVFESAVTRWDVCVCACGLKLTQPLSSLCMQLTHTHIHNKQHMASGCYSAAYLIFGYTVGCVCFP